MHRDAAAELNDHHVRKIGQDVSIVKLAPTALIPDGYAKVDEITTLDRPLRLLWILVMVRLVIP